MGKFKVGDRVKVVIGFGVEGRMGFVTDVLPHGASVASDTSVEEHTQSEDGKEFHCFFLNNEIGPMPHNTIQLNHQYTSKNGQKWECIAVRGDTAWLLAESGKGAAYTFKLDGTNICQGGGEWDIKWEPVVEWVEREEKLTRVENGGLTHYGYKIRVPFTDGTPDFTQATVTPI